MGLVDKLTELKTELQEANGGDTGITAFKWIEKLTDILIENETLNLPTDPTGPTGE